MAFELNHSAEPQDDCKTGYFIDETGLYDASTNPTGYGAPNVAISAIIQATILVVPYGFTAGYLFTFTIVTGVITVCTVTSPTGVVTNITALLTNTVFPFSDDQPFVFIADWLGFGIDSKFDDNAYYFEYNITDGTNPYTSSSDNLFSCQTCCCVKTAEATLDGDCDCGDQKIESTFRARLFLDAAVNAIEINGDVDKAVNCLNAAKSFCKEPCKSC